MEIFGSLGGHGTRGRRSLFRFQGVPPRLRHFGVRGFVAYLSGEALPAQAGILFVAQAAAPQRPGEPLDNCIASTSIFVLPSYKEPTVDALASTTDEGRG